MKQYVMTLDEFLMLGNCCKCENCRRYWEDRLEEVVTVIENRLIPPHIKQEQCQ